MTPFQIAGIFLCVLFAAWSLGRLRRRLRPRWLSLLGMLLGVLGAVTIFDPDLTTTVARSVGIARGSDLLSYLVALAFLGSWFYFYQRIRSLSNAVTALTRELAVRDARPPLIQTAVDRPGQHTPTASPDGQENGASATE